jgi:hypothetical protein
VSFVFRQPAGPNQRFAPGCFDGSVGRQIPVGASTGSLLSYVVADDGSYVDLTFTLLPPEGDE